MKGQAILIKNVLRAIPERVSRKIFQKFLKTRDERPLGGIGGMDPETSGFGGVGRPLLSEAVGVVRRLALPARLCPVIGV
jgi:hypothetical protein